MGKVQGDPRCRPIEPAPTGSASGPSPRPLAAEAGDPSAQFAMAEYHLSDEDPAVMLRGLRASACQGYPLAQVSLGVLYTAGDRLSQNPWAAYAWFT